MAPLLSGLPKAPPHSWGPGLLRACVVIGLISWIAWSFGSRALLGHLTAADPCFVLAAVLVIFGNLSLRAWRWQLLFASGRIPGLWASFAAIAASYLFNNVLPARPGDVLRVFMLSSLAGMAKARALASVLIERIFDLLFACFLFALTTRLRPLEPWLNYGALLLGAGALLALLLLFGMTLFRRQAADLILASLRHVPARFLERLSQVFETFSVGIADLLRLRSALPFLAVTTILWMTEGFVVLLTARALAIDLSFLDTIIVMLVAVFASFVPTGPGQLGIFEAAVVAGMTSFGFAAETALALALLWHMLLLVTTSGIGALCLLVERRAMRTQGSWRALLGNSPTAS